MTLHLETEVAADFRAVFAGFNRDLFEALNPPGLPVRLLRFDGSREGDVVEIGFPFGLKWRSLIVEDGASNAEMYFVDEGVELPFPLKSWRHQHRIQKIEDGRSRIVDHIEYSTGSGILDRLIYPAMYAQFAYRKPIYRRWFSRKTTTDRPAETAGS